MHRLLKPVSVYWVFLILCIGIHGSHFLSFSYNSPIDYRNVYLGARIWMDGKNPYNDSVLKQTWFERCDAEHIANDQPPGLPQNFLVYPPSVLPVASMFAWMPWKMAVWVNLALCLAALMLTVYLWQRMTATQLPWYGIWIPLFAFKGTFHALLVGQPTFWILALGTAAVYVSIYRNRQLAAGFLLGLSTIKPTMALPFIMYLLHRRQWKTLFTGATVSLVWIGIAFFFYPNPEELVQGFVSNARDLKTLIYGSNQVYFMTTLTDFTVWIQYLIPGSEAVFSLLQYGLLAGLGLYVWLSKQTKQPEWMFVMIALLNLILGYHLFYDLLLLIPLLFLTPRLSTTQHYILALLAFPLFIPVNGMLNRFALPEAFDFLYLHLPVVLVGIFVLTKNYLRERNA